jgi:hypothetical protein
MRPNSNPTVIPRLTFAFFHRYAVVAAVLAYVAGLSVGSPARAAEPSYALVKQFPYITHLLADRGGSQVTRESPMLLSLEPGAYTTIVRGKNNGVGVGLVEVYNLDAN